jgi:hypothetical protein
MRERIVEEAAERYLAFAYSIHTPIFQISGVYEYRFSSIAHYSE